ncbi:MAG: MipA/OmpV family protein [Pseudomonadota bacterium]
MKVQTTGLIAAAIGLSQPFQAVADDHGTDGWDVSVSAGTILAPTYLGDDAYQLSAVPNVRLTYDDSFFASIEGIGYNVINDQGWRVGPIVKYHFGRDEDGGNPLAIAGDDSDDLDGLGDVDGTVEIGAFVGYEFEPFTTKVELRQGVNGHEGFIGEAELDYGGSFNVADQLVIYSVGPQFTVVDNNYNDTFFGVDAGQSAASGLDEFDAEGGLLSYGIGGTLIFPIDDNLSTILFAEYDRLSGDAADSSLVEDRGSPNQGTFGLFVSYQF